MVADNEERRKPEQGLAANDGDTNTHSVRRDRQLQCIAHEADKADVTGAAPNPKPETGFDSQIRDGDSRLDGNQNRAARPNRRRNSRNSRASVIAPENSSQNPNTPDDSPAVPEIERASNLPVVPESGNSGNEEPVDRHLISVFDRELSDHGGGIPQRQTLDPNDLRASLEAALRSHAAWSAIVWKNGLRAGQNHEGAVFAVVDWDSPGHEAVPDCLRDDPLSLCKFVRSLRENNNVPLPSLAHATQRGIRLIWSLDRVVKDAEEYRELLGRLCLDFGGDLQAASLSVGFAAAKHLKRSTLVEICGVICVDEFLKSTPAWALNATADRYDAALESLGLQHGRNPSRLCPRGNHNDSGDSNIVVYERGVMCFSQHGFIPARDVIEAAGLQSAEHTLSLAALARREIGRFVAMDQTASLLAAAIKQQLGWSDRQRRTALQCLIAWARRISSDDQYWVERLSAIFAGRYPDHAREFWTGDGFAHRRHHSPSAIRSLSGSECESYSVEPLTPRKEPSVPLAVALAPRLAAITGKGNGDAKAAASRGIDRFLAGESSAVAASSLVAIDVIDRPVPHLKGGWRIPRNSCELPRLVQAVRPTAKSGPAVGVVGELMDDLQATFAFADEEMFARCMAYIMQPMLTPHMPGLFPGYVFTGPTRSGKTFLAAPFPSTIYRHNAGDSVFSTRFPSTDYELALILDAHPGVLYAVFDEAIDLTDGQLKMVDQLVTAESHITRKMRHGYLARPNHLTLALTAVAMTLSPETEGRFLEIHLTEPRAVEAEAFFRKWRTRGPLVLRGLFDRLAAIPEVNQGDSIPGRRPGFGVLKRVLRDAFGLVAKFELAACTDEILDLLCLAFLQGKGTSRGSGWRRLSFSIVAELFREATGLRANRKTIERKVTTALGYRSTADNPALRGRGYRAENGMCCDIEIREESDGGGLKRRSVYVRRHLDAESGHEPDIDSRAVRESAMPASASEVSPVTADESSGDVTLKRIECDASEIDADASEDSHE